MSPASAPSRARPGAARQALPAAPSGFLSRKTGHERYNDVLLIGFVLCIAWVPLPFGSNYLTIWGINAVLFAALLILFEAGLLVSGAPHPVAPRRLWWVLALFGLLTLWILLQLAPFVPVSWQNPFWELARAILSRVPGGPEVAGSISVSPDSGIRTLVRLLTNAACFYLALQLCRDSRRADLFLTALVVIGVVYAVFGIGQFLLFPDRLLWIEKQHYVESLTSTFVNRNNYATFASIGAIAAIGLLIDVHRRGGVGRDLPLPLRVAAFVDISLRSGALLLAAVAVLMVALFLTASRAGVTAGLCGVIALICLLLVFSRRKWFIAVLALPIFAMLIAAMLYSGDMLADRLADTSNDAMRSSVILRTLNAILDSPWLGFGYGSFDDMYTVYKLPDQWISTHWDKAHNTYAELLFELGVPAALGMFVLVGGILGAILMNVRRRETRPVISLVALAASVTVLLHALVDFSVQIQAVALFYWALVGAGLAQSWSRRIDTSV
ncbi:O-antigen ligase family protein [Ancylobacter sp. A5.8]|uniref:O-antigen ligase family protein n=1 Tax=Ancylobacter gelatini TaxID=2919920 RepID=UPI001F4EAFFE|nr:O-antigen ligase family protein [Ancylobacter gelatini]MCJ8141380.1 O-antigen ligase family protein [Ancylobacter gelatini]